MALKAVLKNPKIKAVLIILGIGILVYLAMGSWLQKMEKSQKRINNSWLVLKQNCNNRVQLLQKFFQLVQFYAPQDQDIPQALAHAYEQSSHVQLSDRILVDPQLMDQFTHSQKEIVTALSLMLAQAPKYPLLAENRQYFMLIKELQSIELQMKVSSGSLNKDIDFYNGLLTSFPQVWVNKLYPRENLKMTVVIDTTDHSGEETKTRN